MLARLIIVCALAMQAGLAAAGCPPHAMSEPSRVKFKGDELMIVTHATSFHDARFSSKRGIDEAVRFAKEHGIPVVYLQDESPEQYYFMEDCSPDHWVASKGGELPFEVSASHVYVVGGHLELCLSATLHDLIYQWSRQAPRNRKITYFMDGIYSNGKLIDPADAFYKDFERFMAIVAHGRPGGEHWPKLTLLETMGVIVREDHELDYLKQILPRWDRTFPANYRIEVQLNDSVKKVLRTADGWHPPTVLFRFVDSALSFTPAM